jgi:hypothetical protein
MAPVFFAGHRRAVNSVAARLGSDVNHRIARSRGLPVEDLIFPHHPKSKCIYEWVTAIALLKLRLAAKVWNAKAVAIARNAAHNPFNDGVVSGNKLWLNSKFRLNRTKPQRIHHRQRSRTHRKNVAQYAADARRCALVRLDIARMIVAFDLERAGPSIAHVDDAGILAGSLHHPIAFRGQPLQMHAARLIRTVFAPHHTVDSQFRERRNASECLQNAVVFIRSDAVLR